MGEEVGEDFEDLFFDLGDGLAGIDDAVAGGPLLDLPEVIFADALEVVTGALFNAVFHGGVVEEDGLLVADLASSAAGGTAGPEGIESCHGDIGVEIEDDGEVGPGTFDGDFGDAEDGVHGHAAAAALVGEGGGGEAVGNDAFAGGEGGLDVFMDELGARGHVEEHFAVEVHAFVFGGEEEVADLFTDEGAAGLTEASDADVGVFEAGDEGFELGGFSAAIGTVEDDEFSGEVVEVGVAHELPCA